MAKKLAITIAGAVSLGSYEAGVLWEVLDAVRQHNQNPETSADDHIIIDVITGASAGGMTAVILAQKLLYSVGEFQGPYDNPLYNTWVRGIDLASLQQTQPDEDALKSIFSSDLITRISEDTLMARYADGAPPPAMPHPAVDGQLSVGLALTNLNGIPYTYPVVPQGAFTYIDSSDQMTRQIVSEACDNAQFWEPLRQAAVASGAFPIAFRPQGIERSKQLDPADYSSPNLGWNGQATTFTYSDGGILQNQPLGMAKNLVDPIDLHVQEKRFYLFVSPHEKDPKVTPFTTEEADYFHLIKRLVGAAVGQAGFQDWIRAEEINRRVSILDERAKELMQALLNRNIDIQPLQTTATAILDLFFRGGRIISPGSNKEETMAGAQARIAKQYAAEMAKLVNIPNAALAFRDSVLAFETAAQLGARDMMTIYGITAKESELAGAGLQSFLGFFDQKYRDHDYDVGRDHAQKVLTSSAVSGPSQLGPLNFTPGPLREIDPDLDGLQLHKLSPEDIKTFKTGMKRRVNQMLRAVNGALVFTEPAVDAIVDAIISHVTKPSEAGPAKPLEREAGSTSD